MLDKLAKLGIKNIFDAILFVPKSYTDTTLITRLAPNTSGALRIKIISKHTQNKILRIRAEMLDFGEALSISIFHPKPYHSAIFANGKEICILGELREYGGTWQVSQPKIITQTNQITMNFPTTKMKAQNLNDIFRAVISRKSLREIGLESRYIEAIWTIFHPESSADFVSEFKRNGGLFGVYLEAIKFIEIVYYMQNLARKKHEFQATNRLNNAPCLESFIQNLPFSLTIGQSDAIAILREKLSGEKATRCVVMGDVGCGKTMVILACVAFAYPRKSVLLAPTTILARQLYAEARKFLPKEIKIKLIQGDSRESSEFATISSLQGEAEVIQQEIGDFGKECPRRNRGCAVANDEIRFGDYQGNEQQNSAIYADKMKPKTPLCNFTPPPSPLSQGEVEILDSAGLRPNPHLLLQSKSKQKDSCDSTQKTRPLRGAKKQEKGRSSASADFLLEAEKRGSPPKSEKATAFWRVGGGGRGVQPFLREKTHESKNQNNGEFVRDSRESQNNKDISLPLTKYNESCVENSADSHESCHFLIGTHALLWRDLRDFDLFMTDEQHRFGTNQRAKLEKMLEISGKKPHNIQFSATPIPRTMAMIEAQFIDFCFIRDLPYPKNIKTRIITREGFGELLAHIKSIVAQGKQVAIIYPLVAQSEAIAYQSIEEGLPFWRKNFERVYATHGKDKNKEAILEEFRDKGAILVATTLFEVGISLPNLSTIVIVGAERLGFATLHQLRGRVSRNGMQGFCYLYTNTPDSARLREFSATMSGFEIAELDLKYRNSGDLIRGIRQSGAQFRYFDFAEDKKIAKKAVKFLDGAN